MRLLALHHVRWRSNAYDLAARIAAFRPQVDQPIGGADHVEIVFDDQQRMAGVDQTPKGSQQFRDVVEVKAGSGFVEEEQRPADGAAGRWRLATGKIVACLRMSRKPRLPFLTSRQSPVASRLRGKVAGKLQPLRFAAGKRWDGLTQTQIVESDLHERRQRREHFPLASEELDRLRYGHLEHIRNAASAPARRGSA